MRRIFLSHPSPHHRAHTPPDLHARDGKKARAEPVAAVYEQGRVTHCGEFPALEEEMMALGEAETEGRLDRADALVWALTHLMVEPPPVRGEPRIARL